MSKNIVVTHSRRFHIDELMAITLLNKFLFKDNYKLIRTRDSEIIKKHQNDDSVFVVDVGFLYQENKLNFDHHQQNCNQKWSNGIPYSSCGMIWSFLKKKNLLTKQLSDDEIKNIEENIIMKIDAHDNGVETYEDIFFALKFNRANQTDQALDKQFEKALVLLSDFFDNKLYELRNGASNTNNISFLMSIALLNTFKLNKSNKINSLRDFFSYAKDIKINRFWTENEKFGILGQIWYNLCNDKESSLSKSIPDQLKKEIEVNFIKPIDLLKFKELDYLKKYERIGENLEVKAIQASVHAFFNYLSSFKSNIENSETLEKAIESSKNEKGFVIFKSKFIGSLTSILDLCDKDLFIYPHSKGKWIIQTVPLNKKDTFSKKSPMPTEWNGLSGSELVKVSGFRGLEFSHKSGFMCILNGNLSEAKELANFILKNNNYDFKKENKIFKINVKTNKKDVLSNTNEKLDLKECIKKSEHMENVILLDKNYSNDALNEMLKTNKKFFIKMKGDSRWIIGTIDKSKFVDAEWKRLHGEKLFELSNIKELCSCDKKLNSIVVKCNIERAIEIINDLIKLK